LYAIIDLNIFKKVNIRISNSRKIIETPQIIEINTEVKNKEEVINSEPTIINQATAIGGLNEMLLDKIKTIIKNTPSIEIKLTGEILKEIQEIFKPIFKNKKPTIKQIIDFVKSEYANELEIPKKDTISIKREPKLF
jgi:hypothetical protein